MNFLKRNYGKILWILFWLVLASEEGTDGTPPLIEKHVFMTFSVTIQPPFVHWFCTRARLPGRWIWTAVSVFLPLLGFMLPVWFNCRRLFGDRPAAAAAGAALPSGAGTVKDDLWAADERRLRAGLKPVIADATGLPFMMVAPDYVLARLDGLAVGELPSLHGMKDYLAVLESGAGEKSRDFVEFGRACELAITNEWFFLRSETGDVRRFARSDVSAVTRTEDGLRVGFLKGPVLSFPVTDARRGLIEAACRYREARAGSPQA